MSIHINRLAAGIYHAEWIGDISEDDTYNALTLVERLATTYNDDTIAVIINLKGACRFPVDIGHYRNLTDAHPNVQVFTTLGAGKLARFLGEMVNRLTTTDFLFADTIDEAVAKSRHAMQQVAA